MCVKTTTKRKYLIKMNTWETLIDYINKKEIGEILTRTELLDLKSICQSNNSIDSYRNQLTQAGFLKIISPGRYRKLKNIPENISIASVSKAVYDKTYRRWFMNIEDRIKFYKGRK